MTLPRVLMRDDREEPFDAAKIAFSVERALREVGESDPAFPGEIAAVVQHALASADRETSAIEVETVGDLVERTLIEVGRATVAKAFILHRDRESRVREALQVRSGPRVSPRASEEPASGRTGSGDSAGSALPEHDGLRNGLRRVRVQESQSTSSWSAGRIVAALMNEADLSRSAAEEVADRVERRVFDAGLTQLSTSLIRELVDNELVSLGWSGALRRQGLLGLPRHDLRHALQQGTLPEPACDSSPIDVSPPVPSQEARTSGELLRRFALEEVFDDATAERHLAGDFEITDLRRPHRYLVSSVFAELLIAGEPSPRSAFDALEEIARWLRSGTASVVLEEPGALLAPLARGRGEQREGLGTWLRALCAVAQAAGGRADLASPSTRFPSLLPRLVHELAELPKSPFAPRLFVDGAELDLLLEENPDREADFERTLESGRLVPTWSRGNERFAGPGCRRAPRERAAIFCGGALAINLPRLAWRAGPWREDRMLELLSETIEAGVAALESLASFQDRTASARSLSMRGRVQYAVTPVGVFEALKLLGDGEVHPDQGARLLGVLDAASREFAAERRLSVTLSPFFGERARFRFAALDAELPQQAQRLLFDEGAGAGIDRAAPYTPGFGLAPDPLSPGTDVARLVATVPTGALFPHPTASSPSARGPGTLSLPAAETALSAWNRFRALRYPHLFDEPSTSMPRRADPSLPGLAVESSPSLVPATEKEAHRCG